MRALNKVTQLAVLALIYTGVLKAQPQATDELVFTTRCYDAENKWVVFPKRPVDSVYNYGFIYLDETAGFTFHLGGSFPVRSDGKMLGRPQPATNPVKVRLDANTNPVAVLSTARLIELGLPEKPDWLKIYQSRMSGVAGKVALGKHLNHVGGYERALVVLLEGYKEQPHAAGLEFELAFNYNAQKNFVKAAEVLTEAIKADPGNFWLYRELGYANMGRANMAEAEKAYSAALELTRAADQKTELAYNLAYGYFQEKNKAKFATWAEKARSSAPANSVFVRNLTIMEGMLNKL